MKGLRLDADEILTVPQFSRRDVLDVTRLTEPQLKHTLDRNLVVLSSEHNPGTGRRRMFTGGDILKLILAHTMSALGFPMRWIHLVADEVYWRATFRLTGCDVNASKGKLTIATYPLPDGDWARISIWENEPPDMASLPAAFQILDADRLIDETLAKLNALVREEPLPGFEIPAPTSQPSSERWTKDDQGRNVFVGLTFDETVEFHKLTALWLEDNAQEPDEEGRTKILLTREQQLRFSELRERHHDEMLRQFALQDLARRPTRSNKKRGRRK